MLGKWVLIDEGEYYHTGEIAAVLGEYVLVRLTPVEPYPQQSRLFPLEQLASFYSSVFDNEAELKEFLAWIESDEKPKIIPIWARGH